MAIRKKQSYKVAYVLANFSLGEIQNKTTVHRLVKQGRKPRPGFGEDSIDRRPIVETVRIVKGTGIPASTLKKFRNTDPQAPYKPKTQSIKKLVKFYERYQYQVLRRAGVNLKDARRLKKETNEKITALVTHYRQNARKIVHNYEYAYNQRLKAFDKQEELKKHPPKPVKPPKTLPKKKEKLREPSADDLGDWADIPDQSGTDTYLDESDEETFTEAPEAPESSPAEITAPSLNDYPSIDEVLFGMSESTRHGENDWDHIAKVSGLQK